MTRDDIRDHVRRALVAVAPELESVSLNPDLPLRDQIDLDSMDFLRFVMELHRQLAVDVPEADYGKLASIADTIDYMADRLGTTAR